MTASTPSSTTPIPAVLIDTSGFYNLIDTSEAKSQQTKAIFESLANAGTRLFTTDFIVAETHALILVRTRRVDMALEFLTDIYSSPNIRIINVTEGDKIEARKILERYTDKAFSYTDVMSFVVMERLRINHAMTLDHNFNQYGFIMLPHEK